MWVPWGNELALRNPVASTLEKFQRVKQGFGNMFLVPHAV